MALTESYTFPTGTAAPDFALFDTKTGQTKTLEEIRGENGTVVFFICNHCPFVIHVNEQLITLANDYSEKGIGFVAISSNSIETHPQDGPEQMKIVAEKLGYPFPYLYDESQEIAKAYNAACTPDFYVFDDNLKSVYHGQLDDSRPGNGKPVTGADIRRALDNLLVGKEVLQEQRPSIGCNIKWKS